MSILRSGEMFPRSEGAGGGLFLEAPRAGLWERCEPAFAGCAVRARPLRLEAGLGFFLLADFERVIGMANSLYNDLPDREFRNPRFP
jgi:hypothetical protein